MKKHLKMVTKTAKSRSIHRKDDIIYSAINLFTIHGYHGTSMRQLADAVQIEPASLYNHFTSKQDILWHICQKVATDFDDQLKQIKALKSHPNDALQSLIRFHLQYGFMAHNGLKVAIKEWTYLEDSYKMSHLKSRKAYEAGLKEILADGIKQQHFRSVNENDMLLLILTSLNGAIDSYEPEDSRRIEAIIETITIFITKGLQA